MDEMKECTVAVEMCSLIIKDVQADFVGVAIQNEVGPDVRWRCAVGNLNEKYKRITVRYGKGNAGRVISTGSSIMITKFPENIVGKSTDYPIMLAEKLVSSYAVPLFFNGIPKGVLLVGNRIEHTFSEEEQTLIKKSASILEKAIQSQIHC